MFFRTVRTNQTVGLSEQLLLFHPLGTNIQCAEHTQPDNTKLISRWVEIEIVRQHAPNSSTDILRRLGFLPFFPFLLAVAGTACASKSSSAFFCAAGKQHANHRRNSGCKLYLGRRCLVPREPCCSPLIVTTTSVVADVAAAPEPEDMLALGSLFGSFGRRRDSSTADGTHRTTD